MTDKELLQDAIFKIGALSNRVGAIETARANSVTHEDVQALVDAENALETRITALEDNKSSDVDFSLAPVDDNVMPFDNATPAPVADGDSPNSHTIS